MAKRQVVLKTLLWLFSLPQIVASLLCEILALKSFRVDLERCIVLVERYGTSVPNIFIEALIVAEDHRSGIHPGIDLIAISRVLWVRLRSGRTQGGSTIEQQYVRVVTCRYERTISRKMREQLLALMLVRRIDKMKIASAYLAIAFYGSDHIGLNGLKAEFGEDLSKVSFHEALGMIAQLKYPRPQRPNNQWRSKMQVRMNTLSCRIGGKASVSLGEIPRAQPILSLKPRSAGLSTGLGRGQRAGPSQATERVVHNCEAPGGRAGISEVRPLA